MAGLHGDAVSGTALAVKFAARERWTCAIGLLLSAPVFAFMARDYIVRGYPIKVPRGAIYEWAIRVGGRFDESWLRGVRVTAVVAILLVCAAYVAAGTYNPFIYYRF